MDAITFLKRLEEMEELRPEAREFVRDVIINERTVQGQHNELSSLVGPSLDALHSLAYDLYEHAHYLQAASLYHLMTISDPLCADYWTGLGASLQMGGKYEEALTAFSMAAAIDIEDPSPHLHAAECYFGIEDKKSGFEALQIADTLCVREPKHARLRERIAVLREAWSNTDS